jgi:hypothetical protein
MTDEDRYARRIGKEFKPIRALVQLPDGSDEFVQRCAGYLIHLFGEEADIRQLAREGTLASELRDGLFAESEPFKALRRKSVDCLATGHFFESLDESFRRGGGVFEALGFLARRSVESLSDLLSLHPIYSKDIPCRQLLHDRTADVTAQLTSMFRAKCGLEDGSQFIPVRRDQETLLGYPIFRE